MLMLCRTQGQCALWPLTAVQRPIKTRLLCRIVYLLADLLKEPRCHLAKVYLRANVSGQQTHRRGLPRRQGSGKDSSTPQSLYCFSSQARHLGSGVTLRCLCTRVYHCCTMLSTITQSHVTRAALAYTLTQAPNCASTVLCHKHSLYSLLARLWYVVCHS